MWTCLKRIRNNSNVITHYILKNPVSDKDSTISAEDLKKLMQQNKIHVNNLKLSKNDSILLVNKWSNTREINRANKTIQYIFQSKKDIDTLYTIALTQGMSLTPMQFNAAKQLNGFYINHGSGIGKIHKAIEEVLNYAKQEYIQIGQFKGITRDYPDIDYKLHNIENINNNIRAIEQLLSDTINEYNKMLVIDITNKSWYKSSWRILFNELG